MWGIDAGLHWGVTPMMGRALSNGSGISWISYFIVPPGPTPMPIGDTGLSLVDPAYVETTSPSPPYHCMPGGGASYTSTGATDTYPLAAFVNLPEATQPGIYTDTVTFTVVYP